MQVQLKNEHERRHLLGDGRMFRTGDLGYLDEQLCVRYVGRADTQVKIRGYRVEVIIKRVVSLLVIYDWKY